MDKNTFQRLLTISILSSALTAVLVASGFLLWTKGSAEPASPEIPSLSSSPVVEAVKKANPAVVAITVSLNVPVYEEYFEYQRDPFGFFEFLVPRYRQRGTTLQEVGGGSGFLVSADGYIVTNRHVVNDESAEYAIFLNNGEKYDAQVVYRDPNMDLAVIKIEGAVFPFLPFGDSSSLEIGQSVVAIGNALAEFRNTVSLGIISGLSRSVSALDTTGRVERLEELIQTDAAINPGNSGGPLINLSGEVVGVNVATASGADNISFALSSNMVKEIVESVKSGLTN